MTYVPGDTAYFRLLVTDDSGACVDADATPTAVLSKNLVATAETVTITRSELGVYHGSFTLPADWLGGDGWGLLVRATVGGIPLVVAADGVVDAKRVGDLNDQSAAEIRAEMDANSTLLAAAAAYAGSGARTCVITVDDGAAALAGARVRVTKSGESYVRTANGSGQCTFNLDDGTWTVAITLAGYTYAGTTLVVNGDETATYSMTEVALTPSDDPAQCTGYLTCYDEDGNPEEGVQIKIRQTAASQTTAYAFDSATRTELSDATGLVQITGLWQGGTYKMRRGDGDLVTVVIPAAATYALPVVLGKA